MKKNFKFYGADTRGQSNLGWLKSRFSFSFAEYYNPEIMNFGCLRVINDDIIAGGYGFGEHPHRNMEIITIPTEGSLTHKDSLGNNAIIQTGEVQVMSAGTGILHSEVNSNPDKDVKLFQIWIQTKRLNITPSYSQKSFKAEERYNKFQLLVSPDENQNTVKIHQDAYISRADLRREKTLEYTKSNPGNGVYIFLISGEIRVGKYILKSRDALSIEGEDSISIEANQDSDILLFEVPME